MVLSRISKELSKRLCILGFGFTAMFASYSAHAACGDTVAAPGKVFYVIPDGDLVYRNVTLTVPACGQGSIVLSSESGWRTETTTFWSSEHEGQKTFVIVFENPTGDNPNRLLVFKGSYIRGKNAAKYWGDMYNLVVPEDQPNLKADPKALLTPQMLHHYGRHAGGFGFKATVEAPAPSPAPAPQTFVD